MNLNEMISPVPPEAKLEDKDYYIWGGSMVRDTNGTCHLFYSRWPHNLGFEAWLTHSEIAHATSDSPVGPYKHVEVALPKRDANYWDGFNTHNPTIHQFDGKYYLYYTGNTGDGKATKGLNWIHRNNQRIGVAVAENPDGPWKRFDQPLLDVSADPHAHDALVMTNPSITQRPDGLYVLVYKCVAKKNKMPFGGPVAHMAATSKSPTGPFTRHPNPIFTATGANFPAEDPYIWTQEGRLWAIVKDMHGAFTPAGRSLVLFQSPDGIDWSLANHPLVSKLEIRWENGDIQKLSALERPQLWLENGKPSLLFCAAQQGEHTFNVHIPLKRNAEK